MSCNKEWHKRSNSGQKSVRNFEEHQPNCCGDSRCDNSCNRCSGQCAHDQHQGSMLPRGRSNNIHQGSGGHGDCCSGGNTQDGNGQSSGRGQYYNEHNRKWTWKRPYSEFRPSPVRQRAQSPNALQNSGRGPSNDRSSQETPGRRAREEFPVGAFVSQMQVQVDRNSKSGNELAKRAKTPSNGGLNLCSTSVDKFEALPTSARDLGTAKVATPSGGGEKSRKHIGHCPTCTCGKNQPKKLNHKRRSS
uniref:(northern house mosquito) hypothetical protein n=1 Tax=Culex pipiens TaxID=7175 RepID=A0A8D8CT32_CULPI